MTPEATNQITAGTYQAWDCLNSWYGVSQVEPLFQFAFQIVILHFRGVLDQQRVKVDYAALPGVIQASPSEYTTVATPLPGTGSLCGWAEGDTFYYFLRTAGPSRYYTSQPGQTPVPRGPLSADPTVRALALRCYEEHSIGGGVGQ